MKAMCPPGYHHNGFVWELMHLGTSTQQKIKTSVFSCRHCSCSIIFLISCSFETQIMLILILVDIQYSENAGLNFKKFSNRQNHSSSGSHHLMKKSPQHCALLFDTKSGKFLKF